jgi:energy-coupling factor transport system ATP-binding protein
LAVRGSEQGSTGEKAVLVKDLSFRYNGSAQDCLSGTNLEVRRGEHVAIIGPSGSGKTTLCLCMAGVVPHIVEGAIRGEVLLFGKPTARQTVGELSRQVGIIFDDPEVQLFNVSVEEEVAFGPQNLGLERDQVLARVEEALEWTGSSSLREAAVNTLSGGEKQRVAIASVLAMRPPLLILDEPTSMLDPAGTRQVFEVLERLRSREGMTIVTVERNVERLAEFAERMYMLAGGTIVAEGEPADVLSRVELLIEKGLEPPQVTMLEHGLRPVLEPGARYSMTVPEASIYLSKFLRGRPGS